MYMWWPRKRRRIIARVAFIARPPVLFTAFSLQKENGRHRMSVTFLRHD